MQPHQRGRNKRVGLSCLFCHWRWKMCGKFSLRHRLEPRRVEIKCLGTGCEERARVLLPRALVILLATTMHRAQSSMAAFLRCFTLQMIPHPNNILKSYRTVFNKKRVCEKSNTLMLGRFLMVLRVCSQQNGVTSTGIALTKTNKRKHDERHMANDRLWEMACRTRSTCDARFSGCFPSHFFSSLAIRYSSPQMPNPAFRRLKGMNVLHAGSGKKNYCTYRNSRTSCHPPPCVGDNTVQCIRERRCQLLYGGANATPSYRKSLVHKKKIFRKCHRHRWLTIDLRDNPFMKVSTPFERGQNVPKNLSSSTHPEIPRPGTNLESSTITMNFFAHT